MVAVARLMAVSIISAAVDPVDMAVMALDPAATADPLDMDRADLAVTAGQAAMVDITTGYNNLLYRQDEAERAFSIS